MKLGRLYLLSILVIAIHNLAFLYAGFRPSLKPILGLLEYVLPAPYKLHQFYVSCGFVQEAEYQTYVWTMSWLGAAAMTPWLVKSFKAKIEGMENNLEKLGQRGFAKTFFKFFIMLMVSYLLLSELYLGLPGRDSCPDYSRVSEFDAVVPALMCPTTVFSAYLFVCLFVIHNRTVKSALK